MSELCGYVWPTAADVEIALVAGVPEMAVQLMRNLPPVECSRTAHRDHLHVSKSFPTMPFQIGGGR